MSAKLAFGLDSMVLRKTWGGDGMRVVYKCDDGTEFPVDWENEADASKDWQLEREHTVNSPPLEATTHIPAMQRGIERAFSEAGLLPPPFFSSRKVVNGWPYFLMEPSDPAVMDEIARGLAQLTAAHGGAMALWQNYCIPKIEEACDWLSQADEDASVGEIADVGWYSWGVTMVSAFSLEGGYRGLEDFCVKEFGSEGSSIVIELTQGFRNATLEADEELWRVGQVGGQSTEVRRLLLEDKRQWPERILALEAQTEFWRSFSGFMDTYGERTERWQVSSETWRERPEVPLAIIRTQLTSDAASPMDLLALAAERREKLRSELNHRLELSPGKREEFDSLIEAGAVSYSPVREGRAHWQLIACGRMRLALLRVGARLVREGRIQADKDVLFLTSEEIEEGAGGELRAEVIERRAEFDRWAGVLPPQVIGGGYREVSGLKWSAAESEAVGPLEIAGRPASRGKATGRARLITSPLDGQRLAPGEVLICQMTSPPWSPLFAIAGAVVTETGGALSHPAIVAREYGIPCVVAARGAMSQIADGAIVTVDGDSGMVTVEG